MNMERSMLKEKHFSNEYWEVAIACSVYILKRCPTKSVMNKVPQETWSGKSRNVSHLRILGLEENWIIKVKNISSFGIVSILEHIKFKLYNVITKKLIVSRYVEFKEE